MGSESFGHENEVSKSEEKTSATGSKVAPSSMGSLFSPMERAKKAQKRFIPVYQRSYTCYSSLGSKRVAGRTGGMMGKRGTETRGVKRSVSKVLNQTFLPQQATRAKSPVPFPFSSPGRGFLVVSVKR